MVPFIYDNQEEKFVPAFSDSIDGGLWVILLEKAWAKVYKSYKKISGGLCLEALHDLTGAPVTEL